MTNSALIFILLSLFALSICLSRCSITTQTRTTYPSPSSLPLTNLLPLSLQFNRAIVVSHPHQSFPPSLPPSFHNNHTSIRSPPFLSPFLPPSCPPSLHINHTVPPAEQMAEILKENSSALRTGKVQTVIQTVKTLTAYRPPSLAGLAVVHVPLASARLEVVSTSPPHTHVTIKTH